MPDLDSNFKVCRTPSPAVCTLLLWSRYPLVVSVVARCCCLCVAFNGLSSSVSLRARPPSLFLAPTAFCFGPGPRACRLPQSQSLCFCSLSLHKYNLSTCQFSLSFSISLSHAHSRSRWLENALSRSFSPCFEPPSQALIAIQRRLYCRPPISDGEVQLRTHDSLGGTRSRGAGRGSA